MAVSSKHSMLVLVPALQRLCKETTLHNNLCKFKQYFVHIIYHEIKHSGTKVSMKVSIESICDRVQEA